MRNVQLVILLILLFLTAGCASTGAVKTISSTGDVTEETVAKAIQEVPDVQVKKRLIYLMAWNNIPVGRIIAESGEIIEYKGRKAHKVTLLTESNKFLSKIYRVEDKYTSYIDTESMTSLHYEADRKEGNYRKHLVVEYDFEGMEAVYTNLTDGSVKRCSIETNVQDPLSTVFYFMALPLKVGEEVAITVNLNEKNYKLFGKVEDISMIKLRDLGEIPAFKIRPYAEVSGKRVKKGRVWMYFAADKRRFPLYGVVSIPFGKVTATLRSVEDI